MLDSRRKRRDVDLFFTEDEDASGKVNALVVPVAAVEGLGDVDFLALSLLPTMVSLLTTKLLSPVRGGDVIMVFEGTLDIAEETSRGFDG